MGLETEPKQDKRPREEDESDLVESARKKTEAGQGSLLAEEAVTGPLISTDQALVNDSWKPFEKEVDPDPTASLAATRDVFAGLIETLETLEQAELLSGGLKKNSNRWHSIKMWLLNEFPSRAEELVDLVRESDGLKPMSDISMRLALFNAEEANAGAVFGLVKELARGVMKQVEEAIVKEELAAKDGISGNIDDAAEK